MELRCEHKKHGEVIEPLRVDVKCNSRFCGARPGVEVIHTFDATTGELITTTTTTVDTTKE